MAPEGARSVIERAALGALFAALQRRGCEVVGPTIRDGAIVCDTLRSVDELPAGWTADQEAGRYRLKERGDAALFGYAPGPRSWKAFLHPAEICLFRAERKNRQFRIVQDEPAAPRYALLGVRACELAAIRLLDRALTGERYVDTIYRRRREQAFIVAVNCVSAASTCFCASMQTGPRARSGFDLALTEITGRDRHCFVVEVGTAAGAEVLNGTDHATASPDLCREADEAVEDAASRMVRRLDTTNLRELLYGRFDHPRWDQAAARCLSCGNCTMVCPTCFCTTIEDSSDAAGEHAERVRRWDSCFTLGFSYIHGGSVRASARSRYRQWLTHKLASWIDQFGTSGCVGCGRCIVWCPAGIDITEEARAIRQSSPVPPAPGGQHGNT